MRSPGRGPWLVVLVVAVASVTVVASGPGVGGSNADAGERIGVRQLRDPDETGRSGATHGTVERRPHTGEEWDPPSGPIVVEGEENGVVGPFDVREGKLTFHIEFESRPDDDAPHLFSVNLMVDNNLDGTFNGEGDSIGGTLLDQHRYQVEGTGKETYSVTVNETTYGGRIKLDVGGVANGTWKVTVEQHPRPTGGIEGSVFHEDDATPRAPGVELVAIDDHGNRFNATTGATGEFRLSVFRFRDYRVYAREPGYGGDVETVTREDFFSITPTSEDVGLKFELEQLEDGKASVVGTVHDDATGAPIEGATVSLLVPGESDPVATTTTDAAGQYRFDYDAGEEFTLAASAPNYEDASPEETYVLEEDELRTVDVGMEWNGPPDLAVTTTTRVGSANGTGRSDAVGVADNLTYRATVTNGGPGATNATLSVDPPSTDRVEPVAARPGQGDCTIADDGSISCDLGEIAEGDAVPVEVTVHGEEVGEVTQSLAASGDVAPEAERNASNNRDAVDLTVTPHRVSGRVVAVDRNNDRLPIKNAKVVVAFPDGGNLTTYTDDSGNYEVEVNETRETFRIEAYLEDEDGVLAIHVDDDYVLWPDPEGATVRLRTEAFDLTGATTVRRVRFSNHYAHLASSLDGRGVSRRLRDAGVFYANVYRAMAFGRSELGESYDHDLPVDVYLNRMGCGACYYPNDSHVQTDLGEASQMTSDDAPKNREYHEFGHHFHTDTGLGGENDYPNLLEGDENHAGVFNYDSRDSVGEGFAEFYAVLVDGNPTYLGHNLDRNYHQTVVDGERVIWEEFQVAGLLWDLRDTDAGTDRMGVFLDGKRVWIDDGISLGVQGTWQAIESEDVATVRDLYEHLGDNSALDRDRDGDGISDLDELFVLHFFFADENENGRYDGGEAVGYAGYDVHSDAGHERHKTPPIRGAALDVEVRTADGETHDASTFEVRVRFNESEDDFNYTARPTESGRLRVHVPVEARKVEIEPVVPGYEVDPLVQRPGEFWPAVVRAQRENRSTYATHEFVLEDNGVPEPRSVEGRAKNDTAIRVRWEASGRVVVVRGLGHPPRHPDDGTVVFAGTGSEYVDSDLYTGGPYYYTVFRVEDGRVSGGVGVVANATASDATTGDGTTGPPPDGDPADATAGNATAGRSPEDGPANATPTGNGSSGGLLALIPVALVAVLVAGVLVYRRRVDDREGPDD